jgi:hypothetical protein
MRAIDIFGYSLSAIKLRKLRAALTTLGVVIGIAAIVALLSITQGLQATITGELNQGLSANTLIVTPGSGGLGGAAGAVAALEVEDLEGVVILPVPYCMSTIPSE